MSIYIIVKVFAFIYIITTIVAAVAIWSSCVELITWESVIGYVGLSEKELKSKKNTKRTRKNESKKYAVKYIINQKTYDLKSMYMTKYTIHRYLKGDLKDGEVKILYNKNNPRDATLKTLPIINFVGYMIIVCLMAFSWSLMMVWPI